MTRQRHDRHREKESKEVHSVECAGILAIIWLLGAWLIVLGAILIAFALSPRQLAHRLTRAGVA